MNLFLQSAENNKVSISFEHYFTDDVGFYFFVWSVLQVLWCGVCVVSRGNMLVFWVVFVFWSFFFLRSHVVRHEVCASARSFVFTVAILAQGTNRGDALCAALLLNRVTSILRKSIFFCVFSS